MTLEERVTLGDPMTEGRELGRMPAKGDVRALRFSTYFAPTGVTKSLRAFKRRRPFPRHPFGNNRYGDCVKAKQAIAIMRLERIEQRRTVVVPEQNVIDNYLAATQRLYGGGDTGMYETDGLSDWRKPEFALRDLRGRALTIDAYTKVNHSDLDEVRAAFFTASAFGLAFASNMPSGWKGQYQVWDAPASKAEFVGAWVPGSWGGHSMWSCPNDEGWLYNEDGYYVQTWADAPRLVTWEGHAAYVDEMHSVIDSANSWKKRLARKMDLRALVRDVNEVSSKPLEVQRAA